MGDNYGTIANTINQLPSFENDPDKEQLKQLLKQLQTSVMESRLDQDDREDFLEQITIIAEALKNPQDNTGKKTAKRAMKILRGTTADLSSSEGIVTLCK